ncbi:hypothetical protein NHG25_03245 [Aerococcaceae bacterium NML191292]|nr:hypothetical protein [Aerococcaceae bacterium NML210727]MCW6654376.1 hypothetical protein [Aerococcaceae bacterium NML201296]MCW6659489.1 hypothetical protein [Aerococcaceae bacterium NML191292]MCW6664227.1 hypothetical protein [Aerococcaceae bacterium NML191219]MCW6666281.1 hypothetical protein [Aerococcaceae bacterium NML190938]MCW6674740.1 hypothetical protein [Aerococcaceae bacterium NML171108]MCW6676597.1 hypothetical protein [Aerococcaceae bacterium NML180378]MCW6679760.1 hypothetic
MKQFYLDPKAFLGGVVYSDEKQEVVHLSLLAGNEVPLYESEFTINLFVIEGKVQLQLSNGTVSLAARDLIVLPPKLQHEMLIKEDAQILVTKIK